MEPESIEEKKGGWRWEKTVGIVGIIASCISILSWFGVGPASLGRFALLIVIIVFGITSPVWGVLLMSWLMNVIGKENWFRIMAICSIAFMALGLIHGFLEK